MKATPKRSNEPVVWLLFGAGGTISAITFPVLVLIVGFLLPFNLIEPSGIYKIAIFLQTWIGKLLLLTLLIFPIWCGLHRIHHGLHDIKVHLPMSGFIFYGLASLYTVLTFFAVLI
ncbi:fumarate reductase subunit D [Mergibacter septicus]|uniref:fumarate reductase subunit FrdD n=1 Tax=Mergibacter septicus TaxID=221402 RepID=UPI0011793C8C|nr:fumarate reductase subunit FrdD [Mergibacter septicus]AWX14329.1 fumarate reductase subunit D [Mergibacter septicus]QDJ13746.1 fumarate reductase subunit D [Mergibacter septicus]